MSMLIAPQLTSAMGLYGIKSAAVFDGSTGYLSRTFTSDDGDTWTLSLWLCKAVSDGTSQSIMSNATDNCGPLFFSDDTLSVYDGAHNTTDGLFRDSSGWLHVVVTGNGILNACYVNGQLQTLSGAPNITNINGAVAHTLGRSAGSANAFSKCDWADVHFVSNAALNPTHFGKMSATTGNWIAKKYTGPYGTNGFHLDFSDPANLGADRSGNGNDWVVNGAIGQAKSTPTNMQCRFNPLDVREFSTAALYAGNSIVLGADDGACGSLYAGSGTYAVEVDHISLGTNAVMFFGIADRDTHKNLGSVQRGYASTGHYFKDGVDQGALGSAYTNGDIIRCEFDIDTDTIEFFKNGSSQFVASSQGLSGSLWTLWVGFGGSVNQSSARINTDTSTMMGDVTAGFQSLCTDNSPAISAVMKNVKHHFNTVLYTGDGSPSHAITGVGFRPDFAWLKSREAGVTSKHHVVMDTVRGANSWVYPNLTDGEHTLSGLTFDSDGFTLNSSSNDIVNESGKGHVAWCASLPNTSIPSGGTIALTACRTNLDLGMMVGTYTGNAIAGASIAHTLGAGKKVIIIKRLDDVSHWTVYHGDLGATKYMTMTTGTAFTGPEAWHNTEPTQALITIGSSANVNASGGVYEIIVFNESDFVKIGSYVGNGSADGTYICQNISPVFMMHKASNAPYGWGLIDAVRAPYNGLTNIELAAESAAAEPAWGGGGGYDMTGMGVKQRTSRASYNGAGIQYVYLMIGQPTGAHNAPPVTAR